MKESLHPYITYDQRIGLKESPQTEVISEEEACKVSMLQNENDFRSIISINPALGYELLYKKYYRPLCNHVCRFVCSRQVAEDIVSEVFLKFWHQKVFEIISYSFRAYLYAAVRNKAVDHLRKYTPDAAAFLPDQIDSGLHYIDGNDPQRILLMDELFTRVEETIKSLPPQCRKVFILSRFESKKNKEIAMELNIKLKTVEAHMMKALSILRKKVGVYLD